MTPACVSEHEGQRQEKSVRPAWSAPWSEFQASHGSGMRITHLLCPLRPFQCLFAVSAILVLSMTSVSLYPLYSLDLLPLEGEKMTFINLRETNESHYLEFFWDSHYIWWFLLLHYICWFYSYSSYLMVFQSHQRGRDWKMKVIFGSRTLFHILGLIRLIRSHPVHNSSVHSRAFYLIKQRILGGRDFLWWLQLLDK